jgi:cystathionine beta-lyase/cystathionine gamma-synthase
MPYIVTTNSPRGSFYPPHPNVAISRRAVATLEEARSSVHAVIHPLRTNQRQGFDEASRLITESGGTITLPDGTIIEVESTSWYLGRGYVTKEEGPEVLVAWNAKYGHPKDVAQTTEMEALDQRMRQIQYHASKAVNCLNANQTPEALVHVNEITRLTSDAELVRYRNERLGKTVHSRS